MRPSPRNSDGSWGDVHPWHSSFYDDIFGTKLSKAYCEGSARHWRWFAPQDPEGLIALFGGSDVFVKELNAFMEDASCASPAVDPGTGYWIGNQHDIQTPYLFNDAGRPDLTQKWVRTQLRSELSGAASATRWADWCAWNLKRMGFTTTPGTSVEPPSDDEGSVEEN